MHRLNLGVETENTAATVCHANAWQTVLRQSTQTRVVELESD